MRGCVIALEGLDQSGKQTQAALLGDRLATLGRTVRVLSFPDYRSPIGQELGRALGGEREFSAEVMQLLYVANRYEWKAEMVGARDAGGILVCDRYLASSVAYGEAHGLDGAWLLDIQRYLPQPDVTVLLDIPPEVSVRRKTTARDKYERNLDLLTRVRASYLRQVRAGWVRVDADRDPSLVAADVLAAVQPCL